MSSEEFFRTFLNLAVPTEVSGFDGSYMDKFPSFLSQGYFKYIADPSYFELLAKDQEFIQKSEFNEKIHRIECTDAAFPKDFSYWTKDVINLRNKWCFTGIFFPYVHFIVYDPETRAVYHLITGTRD